MLTAVAAGLLTLFMIELAGQYLLRGSAIAGRYEFHIQNPTYSVSAADTNTRRRRDDPVPPYHAVMPDMPSRVKLTAPEEGVNQTARLISLSWEALTILQVPQFRRMLIAAASDQAAE